MAISSPKARTLIVNNRPDVLFSEESKSIVTISDRATLDILSRPRPMTRRKDLFATMKRSVTRLPIARGNPNLSRTLHADLIDSYIGYDAERSYHSASL